MINERWSGVSQKEKQTLTICSYKWDSEEEQGEVCEGLSELATEGVCECVRASRREKCACSVLPLRDL